MPLEALPAPLNGDVRTPRTEERIVGIGGNLTDGDSVFETDEVAIEALTERERTEKPGRSMVAIV